MAADDVPAPKKAKKAESPEDKEQRRSRMRERLLRDVAASVADDLGGQVAYILNHYPDARDSDTVLLIRLWSTFHPDYVAGRSVSFDDLAKLPSALSASRWRAKIQNEYGLYQASAAVAEYRRSLRKDKKEQMVLAKPGPPVISIYSDESGKTDRYLVVGSVWTTSIARIFRIEQDLRNWMKEHGVKAEFKFGQLTNHNVERATEFVMKALTHSDVMSFKACVLDQTKVVGRPKEEVVFGLYYELVVSGLTHELQSNRIELPRWLSIVKDADPGTDILAVPELERRLSVACVDYFSSDVKVESIASTPSDASPLLQLADLFSGSVNRVMNEAGSGSHAKDRFAEFFEEVAGFSFKSPPAEAKGSAYLRHLT